MDIMANNSKKGDRRERELVNYLDSINWTVVRIPASGAGTERNLPDVLAGRHGLSVAIEAKTSLDSPIYLSATEVEALVTFSRNFGSVPRIGVRFDLSPGDPAYGADRPGWYFVDPDDLAPTRGGNFAVRKEWVHDNAPSADALFTAVDSL